MISLSTTQEHEKKVGSGERAGGAGGRAGGGRDAGVGWRGGRRGPSRLVSLSTYALTPYSHLQPPICPRYAQAWATRVEGAPGCKPAVCYPREIVGKAIGINMQLCGPTARGRALPAPSHATESAEPI